MRKALLVLLLSLGALHSAAQEYHPFMTGIDSVTFNRIWCFEACCPVTFTIRPVDTVYRDSTWRPVYREGSGFTKQLMGWFQEDTAARKVYCHSIYYGLEDTTPFLLYDFSLSVGDSIIAYRPWTFNPFGGSEDSIGMVHVDSISSYETLAGSRKIIYLRRNTEFAPIRVRWVEGIGALEQDYTMFGWGDILNCRYDNDVHVFKYENTGLSLPFDTTCAPECFGKVSHQDLRQSVRVFPNPVTDRCMVTLKDEFNALQRITVVNALGQVIAQQEAAGSEAALHLKAIPRGHYTLLIDTRKGRIVVPLVK